jgi:hypothetical protein
MDVGNPEAIRRSPGRAGPNDDLVPAERFELSSTFLREAAIPIPHAGTQVQLSLMFSSGPQTPVCGKGLSVLNEIILSIG